MRDFSKVFRNFTISCVQAQLSSAHQLKFTKGSCCEYQGKLPNSIVNAVAANKYIHKKPNQKNPNSYTICVES